MPKPSMNPSPVSSAPDPLQHDQVNLTKATTRESVFMMGLILSGFVMFVMWILLETGGVVI